MKNGLLFFPVPSAQPVNFPELHLGIASLVPPLVCGALGSAQHGTQEGAALERGQGWDHQLGAGGSVAPRPQCRASLPPGEPQVGSGGLAHFRPQPMKVLWDLFFPVIFNL